MPRRAPLLSPRLWHDAAARPTLTQSPPLFLFPPPPPPPLSSPRFDLLSNDTRPLAWRSKTTYLPVSPSLSLRLSVCLSVSLSLSLSLSLSFCPPDLPYCTTPIFQEDQPHQFIFIFGGQRRLHHSLVTLAFCIVCLHDARLQHRTSMRRDHGTPSTDIRRQIDWLCGTAAARTV